MTRPEVLPRPIAGTLAAAALPVVALVALVAVLGATFAVAGATLGYDFLAYHQAARRVLAGEALYDTVAEMAGGFGLFLYPPTFLPLALPFGVLDPAPATWGWLALLLAAFGVGVALLPVPRWVRWSVVLLAALSWPFAYALKLGQVGPLLFLAFAAGWRWLDDPVRLGASAALGTAIKLQPAILFGWALLTRRWAAVGVGIGVLVALAAGSTLLTGPAAWVDFLTLIRAVSDPVTTTNNVTPGAVAYQLGVDLGTAALVQAAAMAATVVVVLVAIGRTEPAASYLAAVTASQLLSPVLWDHYAMLLLLPAAYLLAQGRWWGAFIPLATPILLVDVIPPVAYPAAFFAALVAVVLVGRTRQAAAAR